MTEQTILKTLEFDQIRELLALHAPSFLSKEKARRWIPSSEENEIRTWQEETEEAASCLQREVSTPLGETKDIRELLRKAEKEIPLSPQEFADLRISLETYGKMAAYFKDERESAYPLLTQLSRNFLDHSGLIRAIERTFDEKGEVLDQASPKLSRIRSEIVSLQNRVKQSLNTVLRDKDQENYLQEHIITQRGGRYVIPIKAEYRHVFRGIVHDASSTGQTLFMEPLLTVQLNNDLTELKAAEMQEIREILKALTERVAAEAETAAADCVQATDMEFIFARGGLAISMNGVRPVLSAKREVALCGARHPLIPAGQVVPIDFQLGKDFRILIITGSNTGGKTAALKTLGLLALMHQAGLFIPAAEGSSLPVFRNIYAVIGDDQSIQSSLSTFSSYMTQVIHIVGEMTERDLVLIDELGSGTDPAEGSALAQAITEYLLRKNVLAAVTTHFSSLKQLAYDTDGIENAYVEFDMETLSPTYRLIIGMPGNSNAFSISRKLGVPSEILVRAEELKELSPYRNLDKILERMNGQAKELERARDEEQENLRRSEELKAELLHEKEKLEQKREKVMVKTRQEAERIRRNLRLQSEEIIKELKQQFRESDKDQMLRHVSKSRADINQLEIPEGKTDRQPISPGKIVPGVSVYVDTFDSIGEVIGMSGDRVQIRCGGMSLTVGVKHCFDVKSAPREAYRPKKTMSGKRNVKPFAVKAAAAEINVIGKTVDEAIPEVDRFLDEAVVSGISPVMIIHGKGTGALRSGLHKHLRTLNYVEQFRLADEQNGGAGATEVYFK